MCKVVGHSRKTVQHHVSFFLKRGWCRIEHGHLKFISLEDLCSCEGLEYNSFIKTAADPADVKNIKLRLHQLLFEDNLRKQEYVMRMKDNLINPKNLSAYKTARAWQRTKANTGARSSSLTISIARLSTLFNCSKSTAARIKQKFKDLGWYEFIRQFSIVAINISDYSFMKGIKPYVIGSFLKKNVAWRSEPSRVIRLQVGS